MGILRLFCFFVLDRTVFGDLVLVQIRHFCVFGDFVKRFIPFIYAGMRFFLDFFVFYGFFFFYILFSKKWGYNYLTTF